MYMFKKFPHDVNYGLQILEGVWAYAYAYSDLRGMYALYETFRRFQAMQTGEGRIPSPKQAWIDLTNTILDDPKNSVKELISRLHSVIDERNLFGEVLKVLNYQLNFNKKITIKLSLNTLNTF